MDAAAGHGMESLDLLFPDAYRKYVRESISPGPFPIEGKIAEEYGVCSLIAGISGG